MAKIKAGSLEIVVTRQEPSDSLGHLSLKVAATSCQQRYGNEIFYMIIKEWEYKQASSDILIETILIDLEIDLPTILKNIMNIYKHY